MFINGYSIKIVKKNKVDKINNPDSFEEEKERWFFRNGYWVIPLASIVFAFSAVMLFTSSNITERFNFTTTGTIGDTIGGITAPIFNLIAGIIIFYSFREQLRANNYQYKALKASQKQQAENTFFSMMSVLHDLINNTNGDLINLRGDVDPTTAHERPKLKRSGVAYYSLVLHNFKLLLSNTTSQALFAAKFKALKIFSDEKKEIYTKEYLIWAYEVNYKYSQAQLGHFFRYIFNIIKYVSENVFFNDTDKNKLINLIQAQLSNDLLGLIFYNGLSSQGKKFKEVIDKYPFLFENIDPDSLIQSNDIIYYPRTNFKYIPKLNERVSEGGK